jgi:GST-like protein
VPDSRKGELAEVESAKISGIGGEADPIAAYPNLKRWFTAINARPAVARARAVATGHVLKQQMDEAAQSVVFPSNYPLVTA